MKEKDITIFPGLILQGSLSLSKVQMLSGIDIAAPDTSAAVRFNETSSPERQ